MEFWSWIICHPSKARAAILGVGGRGRPNGFHKVAVHLLNFTGVDFSGILVEGNDFADAIDLNFKKYGEKINYEKNKIGRLLLNTSCYFEKYIF